MAELKLKVKSEKLKVTKTDKKEPVKQAVVKKPTVKNVTTAASKPVEKKEVKLTLDVFDLDGKVAGKVSLSEVIFGDKVNKTLLAQAVRVYLANKRQGTVSTKTRGEVDGSTRKIYRQKGTGRARHGSLRAPIFVKGGIVFGPKPRDYSLILPKKMKRKALFSALSAKVLDGEVKVLQGLDKIEPKTKHFAGVLEKLGFDGKKKKLLLVTPASLDNVKRAGRNIPGVSLLQAKQLNAYDVLKNKNLVFMKESLAEMEKYFLGGDK